MDILKVRYPLLLGLQETTRTLAGTASQAVRQEIEALIDHKINPMLDRVDAIIRGNITHAADEAIRVMDEAERALESLIDYAAGRVNQTISVFFAELNSTLDVALSRLDLTLATALCRIAPEGMGIVIRVPPFPAVDRVRVWTPHRSECWRTFLGSNEHPLTKTFEGWQAYQGIICEEIVSIGTIYPDDDLSVRRVAEKYSRLVSMTSTAQCAALNAGPGAQRRLMSWRIEFEYKAELFARLSGLTLE